MNISTYIRYLHKYIYIHIHTYRQTDIQTDRHTYACVDLLMLSLRLGLIAVLRRILILVLMLILTIVPTLVAVLVLQILMLMLMQTRCRCTYSYYYSYDDTNVPTVLLLGLVSVGFVGCSLGREGSGLTRSFTGSYEPDSCSSDLLWETAGLLTSSTEPPRRAFVVWMGGKKSWGLGDGRGISNLSSIQEVGGGKASGRPTTQEGSRIIALFMTTEGPDMKYCQCSWYTQNKQGL